MPESRFHDTENRPHQRDLKFASVRGRRQWLLTHAPLQDTTVDEGRRRIRVSANSQRLILRCLESYCRDSDWCWPTQETIGGWCNMSRSTVARVMKVLTAAGLIVCNNYWDDSNQVKRKRYKVCYSVISDLANEQLDDDPTTDRNTAPAATEDASIDVKSGHSGNLDECPTGGDHCPTGGDHCPTGGDHCPTVEHRNRQWKQTLGNSHNRRRVTDLDGIEAARISKALAPRVDAISDREIRFLRAVCLAVLAGEIPEATLTTAIDRTESAWRSGRVTETRFGYFRATITNAIERIGVILELPDDDPRRDRRRPPRHHHAGALVGVATD